MKSWLDKCEIEMYSTHNEKAMIVLLTVGLIKIT